MSATMELARAAAESAAQDTPTVTVPAELASSEQVDPVEVAACRARILEEVARPGWEAEALVERLQGIGFPPLAAIWELVWCSDGDAALSETFAAAGLDRLDLLERIVGSSSGPSVRRWMELRTVRGPQADELIWMLAHLGEHGSWREVELVLALSALDVQWIGLESEHVVARAVEALRAMLVRDSRSYGALRSCVQNASLDHGPLALEALGGMAGDRALETLTFLLDGRALDPRDVVRAVEQVARRSLPPFDDFLLQRVAELAREDDPKLRAASLRAAGALGDERSLEQQVEGLAHDDGGVRSAAGAALAELTGLHFGCDAVRWRSWLAAELAWWDQRSDLALARLEDDDPAEAIAALSELVAHRMQRARLARAIARRLDDESPELRRLACLTLEQLGSRSVALDVLARLTDVDASVRASASACLQTLFGVQLTPEPETWLQHLAQSELALR